jgi:hypothetical protein
MLIYYYGTQSAFYNLNKELKRIDLMTFGRRCGFSIKGIMSQIDNSCSKLNSKGGKSCLIFKPRRTKRTKKVLPL